MDRHRRGNEKEFEVGKPVLLFQTQMGNMPGKLRFRWTGPFWITKEYNGSYQLGTLSGEVIGKWANGFRLKPYKGHMPANPFKQDPEIRHDEEPTPTDAAPEIRSEGEPTPVPTKTTPENRQEEIPVSAQTDPNKSGGTGE